MRLPTVTATMQRRILVNYRIRRDAPEIVPAPFRPVLVDGYGVAGICLIRLGGIRPTGLPALAGVRSENMAHRIAVEWDTPAGPVRGVYIPRRDTSSRLIALVGGRAFPGWHHLAHFAVEEQAGEYRVDVSSRGGGVHVSVAAHQTKAVGPGSVFADVDQASDFFRCAPVGYAATPSDGVFDAVALTAEDWAIVPLHLDEVRSSFFDDPDRFPPGAAVPDSAFLMLDTETRWRPQPTLVASTPGKMLR